MVKGLKIKWSTVLVLYILREGALTMCTASLTCLLSLSQSFCQNLLYNPSARAVNLSCWPARNVNVYFAYSFDNSKQRKGWHKFQAKKKLYFCKVTTWFRRSDASPQLFVGLLIQLDRASGRFRWAYLLIICCSRNEVVLLRVRLSATSDSQEDLLGQWITWIVDPKKAPIR